MLGNSWKEQDKVVPWVVAILLMDSTRVSNQRVSSESLTFPCICSMPPSTLVDEARESELEMFTLFPINRQTNLRNYKFAEGVIMQLISWTNAEDMIIMSLKGHSCFPVIHCKKEHLRYVVHSQLSFFGLGTEKEQPARHFYCVKRPNTKLLVCMYYFLHL